MYKADIFKILIEAKSGKKHLLDPTKKVNRRNQHKTIEWF